MGKLAGLRNDVLHSEAVRKKQIMREMNEHLAENVEMSLLLVCILIVVSRQALGISYPCHNFDDLSIVLLV